jgi:hypothetical protein
VPEKSRQHIEASQHPVSPQVQNVVGGLVDVSRQGSRPVFRHCRHTKRQKGRWPDFAVYLSLHHFTHESTF